MHNYGKVRHIKDREARKALEGPFISIQEKMDGSQFTFGVEDDKLICWSRTRPCTDALGGNFGLAVATCRDLFTHGLLTNGVTYRGEAITKPRHNVLAYERIPRGGLILFEVDDGGPADLKTEAERLGLECVPTLFEGDAKAAAVYIENIENTAMKTVSCLGGPTIEGVVIKAYDDAHGPLLARGKIVGEAFKEVKVSKTSNSMNTSAKDRVQAIVDAFSTEARFDKALQYLEDAGKLTGSRSDIGLVVARVRVDIMEEDADTMAVMLMDQFGPSLMKSIVAPVAPWFIKKEQEDLDKPRAAVE